MYIGPTGRNVTAVPIAQASHDDIVEDFSYHRRIYRLFVKSFFWSAFAAGLVLAALFLLIYRGVPT